MFREEEVRLRDAVQRLISKLPRCERCHQDVNRVATMDCLDAAGCRVHTCAEHATIGGMLDDDEPWGKAYAPELAEIEFLLSEK